MTSSPLDLSGTEKPRQIQENMMVYMRLFAGLPGMTMYDAESFWFVSNKLAPGNAVLRTRWEASLTEERIDAMLEQIGQYIDQIDWFVFPDDQPTDLGKRLEARGMPGGPGGNWLWADLTSLGAGPTMPDAYSLHYTGYLDDTPVTAGTLLDAGGCASIYDISTPPAFRRQGFGGAITHALMQEIRNRGYADTWIWSSKMAKRVYQKLGYVDADFGLREHSWHRRS